MSASDYLHLFDVSLEIPPIILENPLLATPPSPSLSSSGTLEEFDYATISLDSLSPDLSADDLRAIRDYHFPPGPCGRGVKSQRTAKEKRIVNAISARITRARRRERLKRLQCDLACAEQRIQQLQRENNTLATHNRSLEERVDYFKYLENRAFEILDTATLAQLQYNI